MTIRQIDPIYRELAVRLRIPNSEILPRIFERLANVQQAKIIRETPASGDVIAEKLALPRDVVDKDIRELFEKGVLLPGKRGWNMAPSWGWLHDAIASTDNKYEDDEMYDLGVAMLRENLDIMGRRLEQEQKVGLPSLRHSMRIIPKWRSIKGLAGVLLYEDPMQIIKEFSPIVVVRCPCKRMDRRRGCRDSVALESCIHGGRLAQYSLDRHAGRKISFDECIALMDELDKHLVVNMVGPTDTMPEGICNCHTCCCGVFKIAAFTKPRFNLLPYAKSRFVAEIDPAKCTACRICVDRRCPVGALHMKYFAEYGDKRAVVDDEECVGCGLCFLTCPSDAHRMKCVRPPDYIPAPGQALGFDLLEGYEKKDS